MSHIHSELRKCAWVSHSSEMKGSEYPPPSTRPREGQIQQQTGNSIKLVFATDFYPLGKHGRPGSKDFLVDSRN